MKLIQSGHKSAKIVIVGEAPGANEAREGKPFIGASGEMLNRMLSNVGISRSDVFITNVCHVRPPNNDFAWFFKPANQKHLILGSVQLKKDIEEIKPNLVIAFGAQPLRVLTGKIGIEKWRGSILESSLVTGQKVIATYHPAYAIRVWDYKAVIDMDLRRCAEEAASPEIVLPKRDYFLNPDSALRQELASQMMQAEWLAVDIECIEISPGNWKLSCVGFSDRADRALVISCDSEDAMRVIRELCVSNTKKVMQNGQFDVTVLRQNGIEVTNFVWDTMCGHHSIYTECAGDDEVSVLTKKGGGKRRQAAIMKGLAFQTSIYTREPYYKDDGKLWKETGDKNMFWLYNGRDAAVTREIRDVQDREIRDFDVVGTFEHEMSLLEPLMGMTRTGILVDKETHNRLRSKYESEIENLQRFLESSAGNLANAKSPKQMQELLYGKLGLPVQYNHKTKKPTSDKNAINALAAKNPHPVLMSILEIRERRDLVERYLNTAYDADGRMRCSFDPTGTRGGRLASRGSIFGSGTNMQNQPEEIREMYIPDPGKVFIYRDYSQAEARVVAYLADAKGLIELFEDPTRDVHKENASRIFKVPIPTVTDEQRYNAKRGVHAFNYGMEEDLFVLVVNQAFRDTGFRMDKKTAKLVRDGYFLLYPEIQGNFWAGVRRELSATRTLVDAFGRKRMFFGRWDDKLVRDAYSYIPQATVGGLCCRALVRCYNDIQLGRPDLDAQVLMQVHDSILVQAPIKHALEVNDLMGQAMDIPISINGHTFKIPTDSKIGFNWANKHKDGSNPRGLIKVEDWRNNVAA